MQREDVHAGRFADPRAQGRELVVGQRGPGAVPHFDRQRRDGVENAVVYVLDADAVAGMVVPEREQTSFEPRVRRVEGLIADVGRSPALIERFGVEIVVVVSCGGDNVDLIVGDAQDVVSQRVHLFRVGITVVPAVHQDSVRFDRGGALGVGQRAPEHRLLAERLDVAEIAVGERAELFDHQRILVAVFIGADVHLFADEHGIVAREVFAPEGEGL